MGSGANWGLTWLGWVHMCSAKLRTRARSSEADVDASPCLVFSWSGRSWLLGGGTKKSRAWSHFGREGALQSEHQAHRGFYLHDISRWNPMHLAELGVARPNMAWRVCEHWLGRVKVRCTWLGESRLCRVGLGQPFGAFLLGLWGSSVESCLGRASCCRALPQQPVARKILTVAAVLLVVAAP